MFAVLNLIRKPFARLSRGARHLVAVAACQPVTTATTGGGGTPTRGAVPVALLVPHGSADAQESQLARDLENAARLAVSDLSGVQIDLRVYGTAGQAQQAQQAALNAASDGARIIVGPLHAESANAVAVAMAPRNINVLAFSNNPTIAGGNLFILGQTFQNTANRLARYATGQGKSRIMAVYSDNLAGQLGRAAIEQAVRANGATLAGSVGYEFSQAGVLNAVPNIRQTAETNAADAIFLTANTAGALPLFSQMLPETGLAPTGSSISGLSRWDTPPQTLELPGFRAAGSPCPTRTARRSSPTGSRPPTGAHRIPSRGWLMTASPPSARWRRPARISGAAA